MRENLFSEADSNATINYFFEALEELANYNGDLPVFKCLLVGEKSYIVQNIDGKMFKFDSTTIEIHKFIRIISYYCIRKEKDSFDELYSYPYFITPAIEANADWKKGAL